jgi:hypothetical protein
MNAVGIFHYIKCAIFIKANGADIFVLSHYIP